MTSCRDKQLELKAASDLAAHDAWLVTARGPVCSCAWCLPGQVLAGLFACASSICVVFAGFWSSRCSPQDSACGARYLGFI
ncbi:MAG: hypothetical protein ACPIOQ_28300 [Promethearchaeia archaeon]